jgi:hypothetical protein
MSSSNQPTNEARALWAKEALAVFTATTFNGDHPDAMNGLDLECAIGDLVCDLLHYARQQGLDPRSILQQACNHFAFELTEEGQRK